MAKSDFIVGQRWYSNTESQLGLGIVVEVNMRQVILSFPAINETRGYATDNAPLTRIQYRVGDQVSTAEGPMITITEVVEEQGLLFYAGREEMDGELVTIPEYNLNSVVQFSTPIQRLFSGQIDHSKDFELCANTLIQKDRMDQSPLHGLMGSRTLLLPHQLYIAGEVANRHAPRVMLADEVGLGKTIEAGMILHHQLLTGKSERVLILVPDSLVHQWFIEMLRRFHRHFSIFDEQRIEALMEEGCAAPFETEQWVICALSLLTDYDEFFEQALACQWDTIVVDEAHHLHWSPEEPSLEYERVQQLSERAPSLLLLTATPEQVGIEGHFARLQLLDPAQFYDLNSFIEDQGQYGELNDIVTQLQAHEPSAEQPEPASLTEAQRSRVTELLGKTPLISTEEEKQKTLQALLDRHGPGRILFRNRRDALEGFPERALQLHPLELPSIYEAFTGEAGLTPEFLTGDDQWVQEDPRASWLVDLAKQIRPEKILVICHHKETAQDLECYLSRRAGIVSTVFHEGLTLVERDRAAAYFADEEMGARIMCCSEIGSEGRNFQFVHHLVLFDLPLNPDLIEQRIGRLDRIGQTETIQIHVPHFNAGPQQVLARWYNEGLDLFKQSCPAGYALYEQFSERLHEQLNQTEETALQTLIDETAGKLAETLSALRNGRDALLQLNSFNAEKANEWLTQIEAEENEDELPHFFEQLMDRYNIDIEPITPDTWFVQPSNHMRGDHFPHLPNEGATITFNRAVAATRDDWIFLSWEHPMICDAIDMVQSNGLGNASVATLSIAGIRKGALLLETWYTTEAIAPKQFQINRFLPRNPQRILIDDTGKDLSKVVSADQMNNLCKPLKRRLAQAVVQQTRANLETMLQKTDQIALTDFQAQCDAAKTNMSAVLTQEKERLIAFKEVNPNIRESEITFVEQQIEETNKAIDRAMKSLQAIRIIVIQ